MNSATSARPRGIEIIAPITALAKAEVVMVFLALLLLTGCGDLLSLHPLYSKAQPLFDPAIEGRWESTDNTLSVQRAGDLYELELRSRRDPPADPSRFEVNLVDVGGVRFADLLSVDQLGHMLVRVRLNGNELGLAFFDSEWLRQRVPHEDAEVDHGRTQAILVQKTPELRKLVARYANEPLAYDKEVSYRRAY